jgi:predicted transcriptional regulator
LIAGAAFFENAQEMSDSNQNSSPNLRPATTAKVPLEPAVVMAALGNIVRWKIVRLLADGRPRTSAETAAVVGGLPDTVSKQLWVLQRAGVLGWDKGQDRRQTIFFLPAAFREKAGVVDLGFCQLQFPDVLPRGKD